MGNLGRIDLGGTKIIGTRVPIHCGLSASRLPQPGLSHSTGVCDEGESPGLQGTTPALSRSHSISEPGALRQPRTASP